MIYGYEETVLHEGQEPGKHNEIDHGNRNALEGNVLDIQILTSQRELLNVSGENIERKKYNEASYFCVGNICVEVNEEKESYVRLAAKQKEKYYRDDVEDDNWLKAYAEKSYRQYERFQEEYVEENQTYGYDDKHKDEFEEAFSIRTTEDQCEEFLTVPEYANKILKDTLDGCVEVMPIVRRIKNRETIPMGQESSSDVRESFQSDYSANTTQSEEYFALVAEPKKGFTTWPAIENFQVEAGAFKIDEYLSSFETEEDWLYVIYYQGMQKAPCSDLYKYQAIYSLPTWRYPIAQATASIYFIIEVCKAKPQHCPVDVTFTYETYRNVFKPGHLDFNEKWLHHILDAKINLFKTITY